MFFSLRHSSALISWGLEALVLFEQLLDAPQLLLCALSVRPLLSHNASQSLELEMRDALPERLPQLLVEIVLLAHEQVDHETSEPKHQNGSAGTCSALYSSVHKLVS